MRKVAFAVAAVLFVAGCTTPPKDAPMTDPAAVPPPAAAPVGAAGGELVGKAARKGWCTYKDATGKLFEARCKE